MDKADNPSCSSCKCALNKKRRRTWSPVQQLSLSPPYSLQPEEDPMAVSPTPGPCQSSNSTSMEDVNVPLPVVFLECGSPGIKGSEQSTPTADRRPRKPRRPLHDNHMGSESENEDSDEEDGLAQPFIPRIFRATLETPEGDGSTDDAPSPATPSSSSISEEPKDFLDFTWTPFPNPFQSQSRREWFSNVNVGPTIASADPYEIFVHVWDRQFMEHIASETNKYAQQVVAQLMLSNKLQPKSRICDWQDTTVDELYVYLAMIIAMGVVIKGKVTDYWNANQTIFSTPGFRMYMSLRRFQLLSKCLHFRDNTDMQTLSLNHSEAKLFKIQPVIDHLNCAFQSLYNLKQDIALDESLLLWKGWLDINQFIPNKAAAVGIKTYEICESQTGYLWKFLVHAHKRTVTAASNTDPLERFIPNLVLTLLQGLEYKGHTIWMDNFYNSPALARRLKSLGFDCAGTLRTNRQFVPKELTDLTKEQMSPGQIVGFTSGDVDVMLWRDYKRVAAISTYHGDATAQLKGVIKPVLVHDYNAMMGGVDKKDQMLAAFPIERKRTKVWYKKLFRRLLNVSILNSYIISKYNNPTITHRSFRTSLVLSIIDRHFTRTLPRTALSQFPGGPAVYTIKKHHLAEYDIVPHLKARKRRVCVVCKKRVHTYCVGCDKAVCLYKCFVSIH